MESGREPVLKLAVEDPEWLPLVKAAWESAQDFGNHFSGNGSSGPRRPAGFLNLKPLVKRGILEKEYSTASGRKAYYRLVDTGGAGRALRELGIGT
jgi:hypothetical protein